MVKMQEYSVVWRTESISALAGRGNFGVKYRFEGESQYTGISIDENGNITLHGNKSDSKGKKDKKSNNKKDKTDVEKNKETLIDESFEMLTEVVTIIEAVDDVTGKVPVVKEVSKALDFVEYVDIANNLNNNEYLEAMAKTAGLLFQNWAKYESFVFQQGYNYYTETENGTFQLYQDALYNYYQKKTTHENAWGFMKKYTQRNLVHAKSYLETARQNYFKARE